MTDYSKHTDAEIDRLVAERVMGWRKASSDTWFDANRHALWQVVAGGEVNPFACEWEPSTDANQAFEAAESMGVWRFAVIQSPCSGWYAIASYAGVNARDVETVPVKSPARALCEAMLMARDIEEQEAT